MVGSYATRKVKYELTSKLGCSLKQLMTELPTAYGPSFVSCDTVRRWKKKFESGIYLRNLPTHTVNNLLQELNYVK